MSTDGTRIVEWLRCVVGVRRSKHSLTNTLTIYGADGVAGGYGAPTARVDRVDGIIVWWGYILLAVDANYDITNIVMLSCMQITRAQLYPITN